MFTMLIYFPQSCRIAASLRYRSSRFPRPCTFFILSKMVVLMFSRVSERFVLPRKRLLVFMAQARISFSKSCSPLNILFFSAYS